MFGRIARMFLSAALVEIGGSIVRAGGRWVDRRLSPAPTEAQAEAVRKAVMDAVDSGTLAGANEASRAIGGGTVTISKSAGDLLLAGIAVADASDIKKGA
jgi:hypothetical protein